MYDVSGTLPVEHIESGTSLLCRGPPMAGKQSLGVRMLAEGLAAGEGGIAVTTQRSGADLREELRTLGPALDTSLLGVVDCVVGADVGSDDGTVSVSSPADLTGIGIAVTEALDRLRERGVERNRLFLDGLSTLLMYADFERVFRFCHALVQHVDATEALGVVTVETESMDETDAEAIRSLFLAVVDIEVPDTGPVYRLVREGNRTDFEPVPWTERPSESRTRDRPGRRREEPPISSLSDLLERVESSGQRLTLFDPDPRVDLGDVRAFFERHKVTVDTAETPATGPRNFAVLHRNGDYAAAASVPELRDAIVLDGIETAPTAGSAGERLLESLDAHAFGADGASVREMIRISRSVERTAWRVGTGALHAGFQRLSRVSDERRTRRVYERVADRGVDVHLYGVPDHETPLDERFTVHGDDGEEIAASWFVFLDGESERRGLVCEERGDRTYSGFWTFDAGLVGVAVDHFERTY